MQDNSYRAPTDSRPQFCFNYTCPSSNHRMFLPSEAPQYHTAICTKWFVDAAIIARLQKPRKVDVSPLRDDAYVYASPLHAMMKILERKQSLAGKISNMYDDMKQSVVEFINNCKGCKLEELEVLSRQMEVFRNLILEGVSYADGRNEKDIDEHMKSVSFGINSLIYSHKYALPIFKNIQLYSQNAFSQKTSNLKQYILSIGSSFCRELDIDGACEHIQYSDMVDAEQMLLKDGQFKPEALGELVTWQQGDFIIGNYPKVTQVHCPLCNYRFEIGWMFSVGKSKGDYYIIIIQHLLDQHLPFLAYCYSHRISKTAVKELPVSEIIHLMRNYNYDQLDIYDAANTKNIRFDANPRRLTIFFTCDSTKAFEYEYCYCLASSPEDAAYKIVLLMEDICVKMGKSLRILNFKRNYYNLYTAITNQYNLKCKFEEKSNTPQPLTRVFKLEKDYFKRQK